MVRKRLFGFFLIFWSSWTFAQDCANPLKLDPLRIEGHLVIISDCRNHDLRLGGDFCVEVTGSRGGGVYRLDREGRATEFLKKPSYTATSQLNKEKTQQKETLYAEALDSFDALEPTLELMNFAHPAGDQAQRLLDRPLSRYANWIATLRASVSVVRKKFGCKTTSLSRARSVEAESATPPLLSPQGSSGR
jgi:hypothetical protein